MEEINDFYNLGIKARKEISKKFPNFVDWDVFSKSFGFFQWKKKHNLNEKQLEQFKEGFNSLEN